jgi:cation diffusion facilitator CzcD-associated flavoprotein CzcO
MSEYHEVIIVGSGLNGMYQLHRLRQEGMDAVALEGNTDVGGTWFNNRYPGCRFDVESYSYAYFFSKEIIGEWNWKEMFSPQPDNYEYAKFVADKTGIRQFIQFNVWIESAHYREISNTWVLTTSAGKTFECRYLILSVGLLSCKTIPKYEGIDEFEGQSFHTLDWPHHQLDLSGKRVAVIGTGSSGVQVIQTIADQVDELFVFQRRPNWCAPLHNCQISKEQMDDLRARYDEIIEWCHNSPGGLIYTPDRRGYFDVTPEQRIELWESLYNEPGFGILFKNFVEIFTDKTANADFSAFVASKIRQRIDDPKIADELIPTDHGFGVQRVPLETGYYEVFNRKNVKLISLLEEPIERISQTGIQTSKRQYDVDIIVYATGFYAGVGSYLRMDIRGQNGQRLENTWASGPRTLMGIMTNNFPNLLMPVGPQSGASSVNFPRAIEMCVDWTTSLLLYMRENNKTFFNAKPEAEDVWCKEAIRVRDKFLSRDAKNWVNGVNPNVEGRQTPYTEAVGYLGGNPKYKKFLNDSRQSGFSELDIR